jgi:predicted Zn-dependent protease
MTVLGKDQARALSDRVLAMSKAEELHVSIQGGSHTNFRFARNSPSTSGSADELDIGIRAVFGKRSGSVSVNQTDDATLEAAVRRAEDIARMAPEDPELMPALPAQRYASIDAAWDEMTAARGGERIAAGAARCIDEAVRRDLVAAGFTDVRAGFQTIANSKGNFGWHRATSAYVSETARTRDGSGSGWASSGARAIDRVDYAGVAAGAAAKALASANPRPLPPGKYPAILEPACVANLLQLLFFAMDRRSADEGRSFFSKPGGGNRIGERLFNERIHIWSDPNDPDLPGAPWGDDGLPQERREWIQHGRVETLRTDRYWAEKNGVAPVPGPANVLMAGGKGSLDELIAGADKAVLVTSFWYIRLLDPRTISFTGLTRDGVFWVEKGKIQHPVTNFRWNESPIAVLKAIKAMSAPVLAPPRPDRTPHRVPALLVDAFDFSSVSDAV